MKTFYYNLSGGLNTAATKTDLGLDTKTVYWSDAKNVEIFKNKGVTRQNGNVIFFSSVNKKPILGLFGYVIGSIEVILYACNDGSIYRYDSNAATSSFVYKFESGAENVSFTRYLTGLVISNGIDDPVYFQHDSKEAPKACNALTADGIKIRGKAISSYKGRLWIAMGGTLYFSALGRYNDWTSASDAGYISNFLSDIDEITALQPYKDYLAIYKANNTYLLSGSSTSDFAIQQFADKGALNQNMVLNVSNKQYFINSSVFTLEQVGLLSQISLGDDLALNIKPEFETYNYSSPYKGLALHYETKNQIWIFCPTESNIYISTILIFDYVNQAWTKRILPQHITAAMHLNSRIYTASADGEVFLEDYGHTFNGEPIEFFWKSPFFSLGEPNARKTVDEFYLLLDDNYDNNFEFSTYKDYDASLEDDSIPIATNDFNYLIWDSDIYPWASDTEGTCWTNLGEGVFKADITQSNYAVQLEIQGSQPAHNFALIGLEFKDVSYD